MHLQYSCLFILTVTVVGIDHTWFQGQPEIRTARLVFGSPALRKDSHQHSIVPTRLRVNQLDPSDEAICNYWTISRIFSRLTSCLLP